jgi:hypothetical protein
MKAICAMPLCLILLACVESNKQDMATCRVDALRSAPDDVRSFSDGLDERLKSCMTGKGYHFSAVSSMCRSGDLYQDAGCYIR